MKLNRIPSDTKISPLGRSRFQEGGEDAVLLIHGFRGLAYEFNYLFDRLVKEGYTVSLPRLPGHGTNGRDFEESTGEDWLRKVMDEYLLLKTKYRKVYIAGLSMGGLLTLILAEIFDPERIVVMAPAISIRNKSIYLSPLMKYIFPSVDGKWDEEQEEDPERQAIGREYWARTSLYKVCDMLKLRKKALKDLSKIKAPCLTIVSEGDKTVAPDAVGIIENGIRSNEKEHIILKNSPHVLVFGCDKEEVADSVIEWFKREQ